MKKYRGGETLMEPPPEGWGVIIFVDSLKCQVGDCKIVKKDGKDLVRFYLMPYQAVIKKFNIDVKKDLDRSGYCYKFYPKEMVKSLNTYDPSRRVFFCMLDFDGKESEATNWFLGKEQAEEIIKLKRGIRDLRAQNERLKIDNFLARTNVQQYIKENMAESLTLFMPIIKMAMTESSKGEER